MDKPPHPPMPPVQDATTPPTKEAGRQTLSVIHEEISIQREQQETGKALRVRIHPNEERQRLKLQDAAETFSVERVPVNRFVEQRSGPREEGDVVIVPVFETVAVVEMRLLLKEEIRLTRQRRETVREEEVLVRRDEAIVERRDSAGGEWKEDPPPQGGLPLALTISTNPKESDMSQTVIGVFDTPAAAHAAERKLVSSGFDQSCLHFAASDSAYVDTDETLSSGSKSTTDEIRDFFSELFGTRHSEESGHYSEAVRRGGVVLAVDMSDDQSVETVRETLLESGAVDIDERVDAWKQQGYTGYDPEARPFGGEEVRRERSTVLPVIQEEIEVGKREVGTGTVRVYSRMVETPVNETVTLREEHVTIERRPVDRPASESELESIGEKTVEMREMAEKAVVKKSARVVEEVEVGKDISERTETIQDTVRHTEVKVDRGGAEGGAASGIASAVTGRLRPYEEYEADYRSDFQTRYATGGGSFDDYAPAYRYGHTLAGEQRYEGRGWDAIEPDARRDWESRYPESSWERFKQAVRRGWERVTGQD